MKKTLLILSAVLITGTTFSQSAVPNCTLTSMGWTPINDLGTGISPETGKMGGLYPNGSNYMPAAHKAAGLNLASQVQCLNANGNPDPVNGKIGWLSIGLSHCEQETDCLITIANPLIGKNPKLVLVNGARGGRSAMMISTPTDPKYKPYWDTLVVNRLSNAGITAKQVQVIWLKQANPVDTTTPVQVYYDSLNAQYRRILHEIKQRFPNVKLCYLGGRIYGGYATPGTMGNGEPYAYWQGWMCKGLIEDQINGAPDLVYSGAGANSPWLSWGTYNWADGTTPRSDGLVWNCTDFTNDGMHPSDTTGKMKVANILLNFFSTDSTTKPWFMGSGCSTVGIVENNISDQVQILPNPSNGNFSIDLATYISGTTKVEIYNSMAQKIYAEEKEMLNQKTISITDLNLQDGIYFLNVANEEEMYQTKIVINN